MSLYYSKSKNGFFDDSLHTELPIDVVLITVEQYQAMIEGQASGKQIQSDDAGFPQCVDREPSSEQIAATLKAKAQAALDKSDITLIRCLEHGVTIPPDWIKYRSDLRDVINALVHAMPSQPKFPAGT